MSSASAPVHPFGPRLTGAHVRVRIGPVAVVLYSDLPDVAEDFVGLYPPQVRPHGPPDLEISVEVRGQGRRWWPGARWEIRAGGETFWSTSRNEEVLPLVEWAINGAVIRNHTGKLLLHAATLAREGAGLILAGDSGAGKSTLAAGLLACGWQYLCDEFALIDPADGRLHPFPKALCIKAGAFDVLEGLGLRLRRHRHYVRDLKGRIGYLVPGDVRPDIVAAPVPARWILFPQYRPCSDPALYPATRADALFSLAAAGLNRHAFGNRSVGILRQVVHEARCFRLESGDLAATCHLIDQLTTGRLIAHTG